MCSFVTLASRRENVKDCFCTTRFIGAGGLVSIDLIRCLAERLGWCKRGTLCIQTARFNPDPYDIPHPPKVGKNVLDGILEILWLRDDQPFSFLDDVISHINNDKSFLRLKLRRSSLNGVEYLV